MPTAAVVCEVIMGIALVVGLVTLPFNASGQYPDAYDGRPTVLQRQNNAQWTTLLAVLAVAVPCWALTIVFGAPQAVWMLSLLVGAVLVVIMFFIISARSGN